MNSPNSGSLPSTSSLVRKSQDLISTLNRMSDSRGKLSIRTDLAEVITKLLSQLEYIIKTTHNPQIVAAEEKVRKRLMMVQKLHIYPPSGPELQHFSVKFYQNSSELTLDLCPPSTITDLYELRMGLVALHITNSGITSISNVLTPAPIKLRKLLQPIVLPNNRLKIPINYTWANLTQLTLSNCGIVCMDESFHFFPSLIHLDLSRNEIVHIAHLHDCISLETINLSRNRIRVLSNLDRVVGRIKKINLSYNDIESLDGIERVYALEFINVAHNCINDFAEIEHISRLPCLLSVNLYSNPIADRSHYRLKVFRHLIFFGTILSGNRPFPILDKVPISKKERKKLRRLMFRAPVDSMTESSYAAPINFLDIEFDDFDNFDAGFDDDETRTSDTMSRSASPVPVGRSKSLEANITGTDRTSLLERRISYGNGGDRSSTYERANSLTDRGSIYGRNSMGSLDLSFRGRSSLSPMIRSLSMAARSASVRVRSNVRREKRRAVILNGDVEEIYPPLADVLAAIAADRERKRKEEEQAAIAAAAAAAEAAMLKAAEAAKELSNKIATLGLNSPEVSPTKRTAAAAWMLEDEFIERLSASPVPVDQIEEEATASANSLPADQPSAGAFAAPTVEPDDPSLGPQFDDNESYAKESYKYPGRLMSQVSEEESFDGMMSLDPYVGDQRYSDFNVSDNLDIYFREQVFSQQRPSFPKLYLQDASGAASKQDTHVALQLLDAVGPEEKLIAIFQEKVINLKNIQPKKAPVVSGKDKAGEQDSELESSPEEVLIIVLSDMALYLIKPESVSAKYAFSDAPLLPVIIQHPLYTLSICTIYFGFQRCALTFANNPESLLLSTNSSAVSESGGSSKSGSAAPSSSTTSSPSLDISGQYLILTREKSRTYPIITQVPQVANVQRNTRRPVALPNVRIENKDSQLVEQAMIKDATLGDQNINYYQMVFQEHKKRPGLKVPRSIILTSSLIMLCIEELSTVNVQLQILELIKLKDIAKIQPEENPLYLSLIFKRLNVLGNKKKWTLCTESKTATHRLLDECRRAFSEASEA